MRNKKGFYILLVITISCVMLFSLISLIVQENPHTMKTTAIVLTGKEDSGTQGAFVILNWIILGGLIYLGLHNVNHKGKLPWLIANVVVAMIITVLTSGYDGVGIANIWTAVLIVLFGSSAYIMIRKEGVVTKELPQ